MQMHSSHSKCHEQWQQRRCTLLVREEGLGGKGKRPLFRTLASWRDLPGRAPQRIEVLIPVLVKLPALFLNTVQQPIVQHIWQICTAACFVDM